MQTQVHDSNNLKVGTNVARHTYRCQGLEVYYKLSFAQIPVPTATALAQGMVKVETVLSLVTYQLHVRPATNYSNWFHINLGIML